jgi:hypothetical protein
MVPGDPDRERGRDQGEAERRHLDQALPEFP